MPNISEGLAKIETIVKEYGIKTYDDDEFQEVIRTKTASGISAGANGETVTGHNRVTSATEKKDNIMEELKTLLGEELFNQLTAKLGGKKLLIDDGTFIPKHRLDEVIQQRDGFKAQAEKADLDLKALGKAAKGNEELTAEIDRIKTERAAEKTEAEKREISVRKSYAIKEALMNEGVSDPIQREALAKNFDIEAIELYETGEFKGKVKKFDELFAPLKTAFASAFKQPDPPPAGKKQGMSGNLEKNPFSKKTPNLQEQIRIFREDPKQAQSLREAALQES